jgi:hypothetical protein
MSLHCPADPASMNRPSSNMDEPNDAHHMRNTTMCLSNKGWNQVCDAFSLIVKLSIYYSAQRYIIFRDNNHFRRELLRIPVLCIHRFTDRVIFSFTNGYGEGRPKIVLSPFHQTISSNQSWRRILKSWRRIRRINYLFCLHDLLNRKGDFLFCEGELFFVKAWREIEGVPFTLSHCLSASCTMVTGMKPTSCFYRGSVPPTKHPALLLYPTTP